VTALAEEFAAALRGELDFRCEGRAAVDIAEAVTGHPGVHVPEIVEAHTTERLLVMERLHGPTLSSVPRERLPADARSVADDLCASQDGAMLAGQRFHGDPHPGNLLLAPDGTLGLIDFGITGRLDAFERAALGGEELRERMAPASVGELVQHEWAQLGPLLRRAPRHLDRIATQLEHGGLSTRVRLFADAADVRVAERLLNGAVLTAVSLGVALLSVLMLGTDAGPELAGTEVRLLEVLGWAGLCAGTVLLLRVILDVLRTDGRQP
jgi:hypothetical protein